MNQTLKGKTVEVQIGNKTYLGHLDKDIASAIEWFIENLREDVNKSGATILIKEAFVGVQK